MTYPSEWSHVFRLLDRLHQGSQPGQWYARCPAHDDKRPSLAISVRGDSLAVRCCAASNCSFEAIRTALAHHAGQSVFFKPYNGERWQPRRQEDRVTVEAVYPYADEHGEILYEVCRGRDADGNKRFWQRVPDSSMPGGHRLTLDGVRRVLFNLPDLYANAQLPPEKRRWVVCVEGEKDCLNLTAIGVLATTNSGGAGRFHAADYRILAGQKVVILPDHDPINSAGRRPGWDHALQVADCLHPIAAEVRIAQLPVAEGQDVSDWLAALPAEWDAKQRKWELWKFCTRARVYTPYAFGMPVPAFVRAQLAALTQSQNDMGRFQRADELANDLQVQVAGLANLLQETPGLKPDPAALLARLTALAATAQRGAADLRLLASGSSGG